MAYRAAGRRPDPDVPDLVLTDRIRSSLGPLEKRLDVPHVHVMVENHVALLHGEVRRERDAEQLVAAVGAVPGVAAVQSHLHLGLIEGDTTPSVGRLTRPPSEARRRLLATATAGGLDDTTSRWLVAAVLSNLADRLPAGERQHVAAHLPRDLRYLLAPPWRAPTAMPRTASAFVARIAAENRDLPEEGARAAVGAVLWELRALIPEEAADVAAVLPADLRAFWARQPDGDPSTPPRGPTVGPVDETAGR